MKEFKFMEKVKLVERTEISPLFFLDKDMQGTVIGTTFPNHYLVKFDDEGAYWVDGKHLINSF